MSLSLSRQLRKPISAQEFRALPKRQPEFLIDTLAINRRLATRRTNPFRTRVGSFQIPEDASEPVFQGMMKAAIKRWLDMEARDGWAFRPEMGRLRYLGRIPATDTVTGKPREGYWEYNVQGVFATVAKPMRIELPMDMVKQAPDHTLTLQEAIRMNMKYGMKLPVGA